MEINEKQSVCYPQPRTTQARVAIARDFTTRFAYDIPLLVDHFLGKYTQREGRSEAGIADEAMELLRHYGWPGNVRELENVVERALALSKSGVILPSDLPAEIRGEGGDRPPLTSTAAGINMGIIEDRPTLAELEQRYVSLILQQEGGNKKRAAEILGIDRRTLYRTLDRTTDRIADRVGDRISDRVSDRVSDRAPERSAERVSDRPQSGRPADRAPAQPSGNGPPSSGGPASAAERSGEQDEV